MNDFSSDFISMEKTRLEDIHQLQQGHNDAYLAPFSGRKFENVGNDCYVNATMNLLLSSNEIRRGILSSQCDCGLCAFLRKVIADSNILHKPGEIKTHAGRYKHRFNGRQQQDAQELLIELVEHCNNLKLVCSYDTIQNRICSNCSYATTGLPETGNTILHCHIDATPGACHMINDMTKNKDSAFNMRCEQCKVNSEIDQEGVHHKATVSYTKLPEVLLVSVNRFDGAGSGRKLTNNIHPSSICNLEKKRATNIILPEICHSASRANYKCWSIHNGT